MQGGGDIDDACFLGLAQQWKEEVGEQEMAEVVGRHGHLHSLFIHFLLVHHHTRIIDEDVDVGKLFFHAFRKGFYGTAFGEVKGKRANATFGVRERFGNALNSRGILLLIPASKDDVMSVCEQASCRFKANTRISTSDHDILGLHLIKIIFSVGIGLYL